MLLLSVTSRITGRRSKPLFCAVETSSVAAAWSRTPAQTGNPAEAACSAMARPRPRDAPVTRTAHERSGIAISVSCYRTTNDDLLGLHEPNASGDYTLVHWFVADSSLVSGARHESNGMAVFFFCAT